MILPVFVHRKQKLKAKVRTLYQSEIVATKEGFDYVVTGSDSFIIWSVYW